MTYKTYFSVWAAFERLKETPGAALFIVDRKHEDVIRFQLVAAGLLAEIDADETERFEIYEKVEVIADDPAESV